MCKKKISKKNFCRKTPKNELYFQARDFLWLEFLKIMIFFSTSAFTKWAGFHVTFLIIKPLFWTHFIFAIPKIYYMIHLFNLVY